MIREVSTESYEEWVHFVLTNATARLKTGQPAIETHLPNPILHVANDALSGPIVPDWRHETLLWQTHDGAASAQTAGPHYKQGLRMKIVLAYGRGPNVVEV